MPYLALFGAAVLYVSDLLQPAFASMAEGIKGGKGLIEWAINGLLQVISIGAKMLIPFYTDLFAGYSIPTTASSLVAFYQGRTPVYAEFAKVVAGNP